MSKHESSMAERTSHKRQKTHKSRQILSQNRDDALTDGRLDVPQFVQARQFEIRQLETSMDNSRKSGKQRSFQALPRSLRRRTANHNVKRVPKRIRRKALREMKDDKVPLYREKKLPRGHQRRLINDDERVHQRHQTAKKQEMTDTVLGWYNDDKQGDDDNQGQQMDLDLDLDLDLDVEVSDYVYNKVNIGVNTVLPRPVLAKIRFEARQKDKTWLPTHVWHAKRAHMVSRWGFAVPDRPTEKCYRPTHRAINFAGAVAWDMSYYSVVTFHSGQVEQLKILATAMAGSQAAALKYTCGRRCLDTMLTRDEQVIGPIQLLWSRDQTSFLVRAHPALFSDLIEMAQEAEVEFHDCRYAIGSLELAGPKSLMALHSVLQCRDSNSTLARDWAAIATLANSASLPSDIILNLQVDDPRFRRGHKVRRSNASETHLSTLLAQWPDHFSEPSSLFSEKGIAASYKWQLSLKGVNSRRTEAGPGIEPVPTDKDPQVPVTLIKRPHGNGWTVLVPWGWVLPLWHSLMEVTDVRLGGIQQMRQLAYEYGRAYFPRDYLQTPQGISENGARAAELRKEWDKRPPAKRISYDAVVTGGLEDQPRTKGEHGDPFSCDFAFIAAFKSKAATEVVSSTTMQSVLDHVKKSPKETDTVFKVCPVRLTYLDRGTANECARIYSIPRGSGWEKLLRAHLAGDCKTVKDISVCAPSPLHLIGFVTNGGFSLVEGRGHAIGSVLKDALAEYCLVRNSGMGLARLVRCEVISSA